MVTVTEHDASGVAFAIFLYQKWQTRYDTVIKFE